MAHAGLGVQPSVVLRLDVAVLLAEVRVDLLHKVGAVLVAAVDAALQCQSLNGVDVWVADDVLKMPLHGVNPAFQVQTVVDFIAIIGVVDRRVNVVDDVVVFDGLVKNNVAMSCK